jgi:MFS transporter, ACS family, glucarate transporter
LTIREIKMPYRYRVLALLFFLVMIMFLDRLCIAVAGPRIQHELNISPRQWGWVIGAFTISYALFEIPSGLLADRIGPRRVLLRIVLWWSGFTALTGAVSGFPSLLAVRFLFGGGEAGAFPNCASVVSRWIPPTERARASSVFWVAVNLASAIAPFIIVGIQKNFGWRPAFYIFGGLGVIWAIVWYAVFEDTPKQKRGVSSEERKLIGEPALRTTPVPWSRLFRDPNFQLLLLMYHCYCYGAYFFSTWFHTYLQAGRGLTEDEMKFAASLPFWASMAGIIAGGYFSDRLARKYSLRVARCTIGSLTLILSGLVLLSATFTRNNWWAVALITISHGLMDAMLPITWSLCVDLGREHSGAVSAAMNMAGQVGSLISGVGFGYLVQLIGSYDRALMPLAAMLIVSGCLYAAIKPTRQVEVAV